MDANDTAGMIGNCPLRRQSGIIAPDALVPSKVSPTPGHDPRAHLPVRLSPESLPGQLTRGLRSVYLVTGAEPLLIAEACDAIRAKAREQGYGDREVHFLERGFDWNALLADTSNLSLFATRRLIELRLGSAPDAQASEALAELAAKPPVDTLLLVSGELERKPLTAKWVGAFEQHGVLVVAQPVSRPELPAWIRARLSAKGISLEPEAAALLADRVEGNLLAAQQEIERIALLMPGASVDVATVAGLVADSARYDVFELAGATFSGQAARALRILAGLRAEGREPPLVLWALVNDLRALSRLLQRTGAGQPLADAMRQEQVWSMRQGPLGAALRRFSRRQIDDLLHAASRTDRIAKGALPGDPWVALEGLVARLSGVRIAA
jgi:DNA polymerase-3 subunit delta